MHLGRVNEFPESPWAAGGGSYVGCLNSAINISPPGILWKLFQRAEELMIFGYFLICGLSNLANILSCVGNAVTIDRF